MSASILQFPPAFEQLDHFRIRYDAAQKTLWTYMQHQERMVFSDVLLEDFLKCYRHVERHNRKQYEDTGACPILYTVLASGHPTVYSYGGDILLFRKLILEKDREGLRRYARLCIDAVHLVSVNCNLPMTTISLVQGEALGGGFEGSICCSVVIAEKRARFGLPEILFNLFPGMGAYHFLARRVPLRQVEEIMTSGRVYTAQDMYDRGVIDVLAEDGQGEKAAYDYIRDHSRRAKARHAISQVRQDVFGISKESLERTAELWVETALNLDDSDLRIMERIIRVQSQKNIPTVGPHRAEEGGI